MKKTKKKQTLRKRLPDRASEFLVNQRMLESHRDEIKADIRSHDRRFDAIEAKLDSMDARFDSMDAKFDSMDAKNESFRQKISADVARVVALVEEQKNLNRAVLDGYQSIYDRQERVEKHVEEMDQTLLSLKKISS